MSIGSYDPPKCGPTDPVRLARHNDEELALFMITIRLSSQLRNREGVRGLAPASPMKAIEHFCNHLCTVSKRRLLHAHKALDRLSLPKTRFDPLSGVKRKCKDASAGAGRG